MSLSVFEQGDAERMLVCADTLPSKTSEIRYLSEFLRLGPKRLIETSDLLRLVIRQGDEFIPVVVNDGSESLCYLVSPEVHYVRYMQEELAKIRKSPSAIALSIAVGAMGRVASPLGFNRFVSVNNWLLTTSQSIRWTRDGLGELTAYLARRFIDFPVVFRGVDLRRAEARPMFEAAGCDLVIHRPVLESNASSVRASRDRKRLFRGDQRLLEQSRFELRIDADLEPGEERAIARLYRQLYLEKHSRFNVRYTPEFFRRVLDVGLERLVTARLNGELVGFITTRNDGDRLICALVGYDVRLSQREFPIYRTMMAAALRMALAEQKICFLSTGNATFKRQRGGMEWFEYEAVYQRHLRPHRRLPWWMFRKAFDRAKNRVDTGQI